MNSLKSIFFYLCFLAAAGSYGQNIAINDGGSAPDGSAMLDVSSTTRGLLIPRMGLTQRNALVNPANSLLIYQTDNTPGYYFNSGTPAIPVWTQLSTPPDNLGNHIATTNIQLGTNYLSGDGDNEGIYIDNSGNLGVGTITPSSPLNVNQAVAPSANDGAFIDIQNDNGTTFTLSGIRFKNNTIDGNQRYNAAVFHRLNATTDYQLNFAVRLNATGNLDTSDIKMTITDDGNVGIGTTVPSTRLTVSQNNFSAIMNLESSGSNTLMDFENSGFNPATWRFGYLGNTGVNPGFMTFLNGSHRLVITNNGDVGIGTTTPSSRLEVVGDVEIPATNDYTYSTAKTRYASIPPSAFVSARPESYELNALGVILYISIGGTGGAFGWASAPINTIPNGARITRITYYYYDNDATLDLDVRLNITGNTASSFTSSAAFISTGSSTAYRTGTSTAGLPITVDYENNYYQIYFTGRQGNSNLRLKNVVIEYTVTEAD